MTVLQYMPLTPPCMKQPSAIWLPCMDGLPSASARACQNYCLRRALRQSAGCSLLLCRVARLNEPDRVPPHGIGRHSTSSTGIVVAVGISVVVDIAKRKRVQGTPFYIQLEYYLISQFFSKAKICSHSLLSDFLQPFSKVISKLRDST